jgi:hypothetical protein
MENKVESIVKAKAQLAMISCLAYSSVLEMKVTYFSETSVHSQGTTLHTISVRNSNPKQRRSDKKYVR